MRLNAAFFIVSKKRKELVALFALLNALMQRV